MSQFVHFEGKVAKGMGSFFEKCVVVVQISLIFVRVISHATACFDVKRSCLLHGVYLWPGLYSHILGSNS